MFFLHELEETIPLHPSYFDKDMSVYISNELHRLVEGKNHGHFFTICVMDSFEVSEARVLPGTGMAEFTVHYRAIVWRPFRGEVCDGVVNNVLPSGFFVQVGPLLCFVSRSAIPSEIKFDGNATPPQFTDNADQVIESGTHIRIKLTGIRSEVQDMFAIATIKEDYLG
ncbi:hypothetical protein LTR28_010400 [Elasticomyces elasticus]|nr:DNA-directed RNA polymerase II subunit [Elasticomyces elasticus]KAK5003248.1 hypothetical protein LTR28_010400 [Elasticomyces elasticus]